MFISASNERAVVLITLLKIYSPNKQIYKTII